MAIVKDPNTPDAQSVKIERCPAKFFHPDDWRALRGCDGHTKAGLSGGSDVAFSLPTDELDPQLLHIARAPRFSTFVRRAGRRAKKKT